MPRNRYDDEFEDYRSIYFNQDENRPRPDYDRFDRVATHDYRQAQHPNNFGARHYTSDEYMRSRFGRGDVGNTGYTAGGSRQGWGPENFSVRTGYAGRGPKNWKRSDDRIREDVCEILEREPRVDASEIEVLVKDGVVTLRGNVDDRRTKKIAEGCIETCSGVVDVRNELHIDKSFWERAKQAILGDHH